MCDRIAIMSHGTVVALDDKRSLLGRHPWYQVHLRLASEPAELPRAVTASLVSREHGWLVLRLQRGGDELPQVLEALHGAGLAVLEINTQEQTLEQVFLELTAGHHAPAEA
jgi:ABC-2 type transport system ATP-binding protein